MRGAPATRWTLALGLSLVGLLIAVLVASWSDTTTLIPQFAAVAAVAVLSGPAAGVAALVLTAAGSLLVVMDPVLEPTAVDVHDHARLAIFLAIGAAMVWFAHRYRRDRERTESRLTALALEARRFEAAQETSPEPFTILTAVRDADGAITDFTWTYANDAAGAALRHPAGDLTGRRLLEVLPGNRGAGLFGIYARVVETGEPWSEELWYDADGIRGWFHNTTVRLDDGVAVAFRDVTARRWAQERERLLADAGITLDTELGVEARMRALADLIAERVAGACEITFVAGGRAASVRAGADDAGGERLVLPMAARGHALGRITLWGLHPPADEALVRVLTARAALAVDNARLHEEAEAAGERTRLLSDAGYALSAAFDDPRPLDGFARALVPRLADWCCIELLAGTRLRVAAVVHRDPARAEAVRALCARAPDGVCGSAAVVRAGRGELRDRPSDAELVALAAGDEAHLARLRAHAPASAAVVPLVARGRVLGAMTLASQDAGRPMTPADLALAEELGRRAALALDNLRLHHDQRTIAATLQRALLPPDMPSPAGAQVAARYLPGGERLEVGGDFYDALPLGGDRWLLAAGDVCGKGAEAAALTAMARFTLRALARDADGPADLLTRLNEAVLHQIPGNTRFLTAVAAELSPCPEGLRVRLCCAAHPHPLVVRADGTTEWSGTDAGLVGLFAEFTASERMLVLAPGDALVLYTDGITEARTEDGMLGPEGLRRLVEPGLPAAELADRLVAGALATADAGRDDIAVVVVRAEAPPAALAGAAGAAGDAGADAPGSAR
jgi:serine phosphatase RsbU (regulator of sigma subunit)/PAS domain-containing protein